MICKHVLIIVHTACSLWPVHSSLGPTQLILSLFQDDVCCQRTSWLL